MGYGKLMIWLLGFGVICWFLFVQPLTDPEVISDKVTIKFPIWGGVAERNAWAEMEQDFEKKNPGIDVKIELIPIKYEEKLLAMLAAGSAPDVIALPIADFVPKNVFLPIDSLLAADTTFHPDEFLPGLLNLGVWKGKRYDVAATVSTQLLFYNIAHFREAGLPTPNEYAARGQWNWETFRKVCKKLVQRDAKGKITRYAFQYYYPIWTYFYLFGTRPFNADFSRCNFQDPQVAHTLQTVANLAIVDSVAPSYELEKQIWPGWQSFYHGKVSMFISGPYQIKRLAMMAKRYDVAPPPMEPGGRSMDIGGNSVGAIWTHSKHKPEAYRWLAYLRSAEARKIWARLGFNLPGLKALAAHPEEWIDPTIVPEHFHLFYELAVEVFKTPPAIYPIIPRKVNNLVLQRVWEQIRMQKKSARDVLREYEPMAQKILDRGY
ncbi:sugar ABC transporter substrate-binding protein [candidate division KSB1 bacterium]|nr:sugar ABC transporter substrate-binding protein [candidate division KSB1 bacterium]